MPRTARQPTSPVPPEPKVEPSSRRGKVQSAATAVEVLKALADIGGGASLTALAARLAENPAKVHRYLASLCAAGFVVQEAATARYLLGPEALAIGLAAMRQSEVLDLAGAELTALAYEHDLSCFIAVMGSHGPTVVRWVEPTQAVTVTVKAGSVMPVLWSATGRVFGAFVRSKVIDSLVAAELAAATPERRALLPDPAAAEALFAKVRKLGCAPLVGTLTAGISAIAFPVFNAYAEPVAVLTALGPSGHFDPTPGRPTAEAVRQAAGRLNERLGHRA